MIKVSSIGYVTILRYDYYQYKAIPTGKIEGDKAQFFCISGSNPERYVWLQKNEIM